MATLKQHIERFKQWQRQPRQYKRLPSHYDECVNCGTMFAGNYCPCCGQSGNMRRLTWSAVMSNAMDVWGLGTRSMPRNIGHLLLRPGYLIADYLQGHRNMYFPPFKMLFLVVALLMVIKHLSGSVDHLVNVDASTQSIDGVIAFLDDFYEKQRAFTELGLAALSAIFLKLFFNKSPRMGRINMCEAVFAQVWVFNQTLILQVIFRLFEWTTGTDFPLDEWILAAFLYCDYKQLFGFSWWSTLWRTVLYALLIFTVLSLIVMAVITVILVFNSPAVMATS